MTDPAITNFPHPVRPDAFVLSPMEKKRIIAQKVKEIMETIGLDLEDPSLVKTPDRVANMFIDESFSGLDPTTFPEISFFDEEVPVRDMILISNIRFTSVCEHHLVPMFGEVHVAYIPNERQIIGLSKIHSIVRYFSKRPQIQERLTCQIADSLSTVLRTENIAVAVSATQLCVAAQGVEDHQSITHTHDIRGVFATDMKKHNEFFYSIKK